MPIHLNDLDVAAETAGLKSALIVPCNMCPAVTVAVREKKPFLQLFRSFLKSRPFEEYILMLQDRLREKGVRTKVFRNPIPHQWFLCMWTAARQKKLGQYAAQYEAVIVLGCDSAVETVRDAVRSTRCRVIEGMAVASIMNAKMQLQLPCTVSFKDCRIIPLSSLKKGE